MGFKIINKKDLNKLLEYKEEYFNLKQNVAILRTKLGLLKYESDFQKNNLLLNFSVKRALIGKRGSGKTHFIKNKILPTLKNYFIIDPNNEYDYISEKHKLVLNRHLTFKENKDMVMKAIGENLDKTIIIDDFLLLDSNSKWFFDIIRDLNFIIVLQSFSQLGNYTERIDYFYNFGTNDTDRSFEYNNEIKILNINQ